MYYIKISEILKFVKMTLLIVFLTLTVSIVIIGSNEYFKVINAPKYNPEIMQLNYEIMGSGEKTFVFIHGLTGSKNYWKKELETISKTHQVLLVDLLGFGDSPKPNCNYSLNIQLEALERIINKESFNNGKVIIVGHSMGAIISMALLEKNPYWFKTGVFISTPVYKNADEFKKIMSKNSFVDRISTGKFSKYLCMIHPVFMSSVFKPDNLTNEVYEDAKKHNWQSYYYSLTEVVLKTDLNSLANTIKEKEVLFIHGKQDKIAPLKNALQLSKVFTKAKFISSKEGDHQFFLKETNFVWQTIKNHSFSEKNQKLTFNEN